MNILEAKEQIKKTVEIYLQKDEFGAYIVGNERQRPVFLVGAPGLGKTAIMKQIARELNVGFLSYTITHHTRQSAIGLPYIEKKVFDGKEYSVTEYTLSEIIASVYETIKLQDKKEGILFIDEINCVSETLAPSMLELLQNKKFGPHKIPEGWILCSAGNPPEYNKSVREFDVVTLDRVKKIEVEPDYQAWKKYALEQGFDSAILYYLQAKPDSVFVMKKNPDGYSFVTPRGWEDLSVAIKEYRRLGYEIEYELITQYVQDSATAEEFYRYLCLYEKYRKDYDVDEIMFGKFNGDIDKISNAPFDERLAVAEVFRSALSEFARKVNAFSVAVDTLKGLKMTEDESIKYLTNSIENGNLSSDGLRSYRIARDTIQKYGISDGCVKAVETLNGLIDKAHLAIDNVFKFLTDCFGQGQELTAFMVNLIANANFVTFIAKYGSDVFYENNALLLVDQNNANLKEEVKKLLKTH